MLEEEMGWGWDARKLCMKCWAGSRLFILALIGLEEEKETGRSLS